MGDDIREESVVGLETEVNDMKNGHIFYNNGNPKGLFCYCCRSYVHLDYLKIHSMEKHKLSKQEIIDVRLDLTNTLSNLDKYNIQFGQIHQLFKVAGEQGDRHHPQHPHCHHCC